MTTTTTTTRQRRGFHLSDRQPQQQQVDSPQNTTNEKKKKKTDLSVFSMEDDEDEICDLLSPSTRSSIRQLSVQAQELMQSVRESSPAPPPQAVDSPPYPSRPRYDNVVDPPKEKEEAAMENFAKNENKHNYILRDTPPSINAIVSSGEEDRPYDNAPSMMEKKKDILQKTHEKEIPKSITRVHNNNNNNNNQEKYHLNVMKRQQQNDTPHYRSDDDDDNDDDRHNNDDDDSINEELNNLTSLEEQLRQDLSTHNMDSMKRALRLISPPQPYKYSSHTSISSILKVNEQQERMIQQKQKQQQQQQEAEQQLPFWWLILPLVIGFGMVWYMTTSAAHHKDAGVVLEESVFWL